MIHRRRLVFWGMCLAGFVVVGGAWLGRSFGIHYDENNYLTWSLTTAYGVRMSLPSPSSSTL